MCNCLHTYKQCSDRVITHPGVRDLDATAAAYYADPGWFSSFPDGPAYPGSGCTTKYFTDGRKQHGALCFDAACAPPDVKRFTCGPRASN